MSYQRNPRRRRGRGLFGTPPALGDISSLFNAVGIAADVTADPYLPETVCRVGQMRALNRGQAAPACATTADGLPGGVGLSKLIKPLRGYVYSLEHKWVAPAVIAGVIGVPMLIGYLLGKGR